MELALQIKEYQEKKHEIWLHRTESELPLLIKQTLLTTSEAQKVLQAVVFLTGEMSSPVKILFFLLHF